jgi:alkaline phosphatase
MGVQTHTAARIYKGQKQGRSGEEEILVWEKFPYTAQSKTYNTDHQVPDSAGTATALFSGVKTRMAVLGIDGTPPYNSCDSDLVEKAKVTTLLHKAVADGKATGS